MPKAEPWRTVSLTDDCTKLRLVDQTRLPNELVWLEISELEEVWQAIKTLAVRGAPAIGVAAAAGLALAARRIMAPDFPEFYQKFCRAKAYLAGARPTAVNLSWALNRMKQAALQNKQRSMPEIKAALIAEANAIRDEDISCCRAIGEAGLPIATPASWRRCNMARHWRQFIWPRSAATACTCLQMKPGRFCRGPA